VRILVHGRDAVLASDIAAHLEQLGHQLDVSSGDVDLFSEVVAFRAEAVIGVLSVRHDFHESEALAEVRALIGASHAPKPPVVVLVTAGPLDAPHLKELKRSGAAYVVIHAPFYDELPPRAYLEGKTVWISDVLSGGEHGVVTSESLISTIAQALSEEGRVGVVTSLPKTGWSDYLMGAGLRVRWVPNWLAGWSARLGMPALYVDRQGQLTARLGTEGAASALGVPVSGARTVLVRRALWSRWLESWSARANPFVQACRRAMGIRQT
jgi:hypothetical protein